MSKSSEPGAGILYIKTGRMALRSKAVLPIGVLIFGKIYVILFRILNFVENKRRHMEYDKCVAKKLCSLQTVTEAYIADKRSSFRDKYLNSC